MWAAQTPALPQVCHGVEPRSSGRRRFCPRSDNRHQRGTLPVAYPNKQPERSWSVSAGWAGAIGALYKHRLGSDCCHPASGSEWQHSYGDWSAAGHWVGMPPPGSPGPVGGPPRVGTAVRACAATMIFWSRPGVLRNGC